MAQNGLRMGGCVESISNITAGLAKKDRFIQVKVSPVEFFCLIVAHPNEEQAAKELSALIQANYASEDDVVQEKFFASCKRAVSLLKSRFPPYFHFYENIRNFFRVHSLINCYRC